MYKFKSISRQVKYIREGVRDDNNENQQHALWQDVIKRFI